MGTSSFFCCRSASHRVFTVSLGWRAPGSSRRREALENLSAVPCFQPSTSPLPACLSQYFRTSPGPGHCLYWTIWRPPLYRKSTLRSVNKGENAPCWQGARGGRQRAHRVQRERPVLIRLLSWPCSGFGWTAPGLHFVVSWTVLETQVARPLM